jgi:hypothetical protein
MEIQMSLPFDKDELDGRLFELYTKSPNREFQSHVRFIEADSLVDAEDFISEIDSDYWKKMSIRPVNVEYVWDTFESLHVSYHLCKSVLRLEDIPID